MHDSSSTKNNGLVCKQFIKEDDDRRCMTDVVV